MYFLISQSQKYIQDHPPSSIYRSFNTSNTALLINSLNLILQAPFCSACLMLHLKCNKHISKRRHQEKIFRSNFMQPNTISKINTAAEFLENGIFSSQTVQHSPCFAQFSENWAMLSVSVAAGTPLLFKIHYSPWFTFEKKKQPTQNYLQAILFDPPNLFCTARSTALEWLFLFKAIFVVELLQTPESCKQRQEPKKCFTGLEVHICLSY